MPLDAAQWVCLMQWAAACEDLQAFAAHHREVAPRRAPAHPNILAYAESTGAGRGERSGSGRLSSWVNSTRVLHMTHIAKTGGRSVRAELQKLRAPVGGAEQCYPPFVHPSRINIVFLRHPRAHVLSMYLHGAHSGRVARRRAAGYPWGNGTGGLAEGIGLWAAHFGEGWAPAHGDFWGYNPLNMVARTLTCSDPQWNADYVRTCSAPCAHHAGGRAADATPSRGAAVAAVHSADFIGLLELLDESLCLAEYRLKGALPPRCLCAAGQGAAGAAWSPLSGSVSSRAASGREPGEGGEGGPGGGSKRAHISNPGQHKQRRLRLSELPASTLRRLDAMTAVDAAVYRAGAVRLLCDLAALEERVGARVLCAPRIDEFRAATAYVPGLWGSSAGSTFGGTGQG